MKFVVSEGEGWTTPATITDLLDTAGGLHLTTSPTDTALAILHTASGPLSPVQDVSITTFDGANWSLPETILDGVSISAFDIESGGSSNIIAFSDGASSTGVISWSGIASAVEELFAVGSVGIDLTPTAQGVAGAFATAVGELAFADFDAANGTWSSPVVSVDSAFASEVRITPLADPEGPIFFLSWVGGAVVHAISYVYLDGDGTPLNEPVIAEGSVNGRFSNLRVFPRADRETRLFAKLTDGGSTSVREYAASFSVETVTFRLLNQALLNGTFSFDIEGIDTRTYRIQKSADLLNWIDLETIVLDGERAEVTDDNATEPAGFYRAIEE